MKYSSNKKRVGLLGCIFYVICFYAQGPKEPLYFPDGRSVSVNQLERTIKKAMDSLNYPGLSIAVINGNQIAYNNTFGLANRSSKEAVTEATVFQGASLSKPLFAYFILKLVEEAQMDLDQPIYPFLKPVMPKEAIEEGSLERYQKLTPRMVLSHTTGIPNWTQGNPISIAFEPGTNFSYSGEAYQHLGAALALKLGMDWGSELDALIKEKAMTKLGMDQSFYVWDDTFTEVVARGHVNGEVISEIKKFKKVGPGFSLHSNALDYAHFLVEMLDPKQMEPATRDLMLQEHIHFDEEDELYKETGQTGWGLGFAQKRTDHGLVHLHTGKNPGFESYAMFIPEREYGFVLFGNSNELFPLLRSIETLIGEHF